MLDFIYDVLDPEPNVPDLSGTVAIVTGGNSGIGFYTVKALAKSRATVVMVVRNMAAGQKAAGEILHEMPWAKVQVMHCDVSSFRSIREFVTQFKATGQPLNILVNNAGLLDPGPFHVREEGLEVTAATNYFGPVYLTNLLLDTLKASAPSRIVNVSSFAEAYGDLDWEDLTNVKLGSSGFRAYSRSKVLLLMWSKELNRRLEGSGVEVMAVHPGLVASPGENKSSKRYLSAIMAYISSRVHGQSQRRGAMPLIHAATSPDLKGKGGSYIGPNRFGMQVFGWAGSNKAERSPVNRHAHDDAECKRLYDQTMDIVAASAARVGQPAPASEDTATATATATSQAAVAAH